MKALTAEEKHMLLEKAREARSRSYSPYSHYAVGAALLTEDGKIYQGCNMENASYTPTVCAERTAFFKAVYERERKFRAIAILQLPFQAMTVFQSLLPGPFQADHDISQISVLRGAQGLPFPGREGKHVRDSVYVAKVTVQLPYPLRVRDQYGYISPDPFHGKSRFTGPAY